MKFYPNKISSTNVKKTRHNREKRGDRDVILCTIKYKNFIFEVSLGNSLHNMLKLTASLNMGDTAEVVANVMRRPYNFG